MASERGRFHWKGEIPAAERQEQEEEEVQVGEQGGWGRVIMKSWGPAGPNYRGSSGWDTWLSR